MGVRWQRYKVRGEEGERREEGEKDKERERERKVIRRRDERYR